MPNATAMGKQVAAVQGSGGLQHGGAGSPAGRSALSAATAAGSAGPTGPAGHPVGAGPAGPPAPTAAARSVRTATATATLMFSASHLNTNFKGSFSLEFLSH